MLKYTNIDGESSKRIRWNPETGTFDGADYKTAGRPKKRQPLGAASVHTLETEPEVLCERSPLSKLKENRLACKETAFLLKSMCDYDFDSPLHKAAEKIENCSLAGAFRSLDNGTNNKIGQALCRNRLCPNCQQVKAIQRRANFTKWLELNQHPLTGFTFYHMVLTVRHSVAANLRTGLYTSELLELFAALRGSGKAHDLTNKEWWDRRISGGMFSVELAPGKSDPSPHIHIHVILFCAPGSVPIYRKDRPSQFVRDATKKWRVLTGDPKAKTLFLKPVYFKDEAGEEVIYKQGEPIELLYKAVAECMKYTLKTDENNLIKYSPEFLTELLTTRSPYFGRFGVLHHKTPSPLIFCELERLNTNYTDLEEKAEKEKKSLYNHKTGETVEKSSTRIGLSYFRNTKTKEADNRWGGGFYFIFRDLSKVGFLHPDAESKALQYLASTIRSAYDTDNDLAYEK